MVLCRDALYFFLDKLLISVSFLQQMLKARLQVIYQIQGRYHQ